MQVGQKVWHVGKNVTQKEVRVEWMSIEACRMEPEGLVLVSKEVHPTFWYSKYALIPRRQLSETPPKKKCNATFLPHINGTYWYCDREEGHVHSESAFFALHHQGGIGRHVYWTDTGTLPVPNPA